MNLLHFCLLLHCDSNHLFGLIDVDIENQQKLIGSVLSSLAKASLGLAWVTYAHISLSHLSYQAVGLEHFSSQLGRQPKMSILSRP